MERWRSGSPCARFASFPYQLPTPVTVMPLHRILNLPRLAFGAAFLMEQVFIDGLSSGFSGSERHRSDEHRNDRERNALMACVGCPMSGSGTRCCMSCACCSGVFTVTVSDRRSPYDIVARRSVRDRPMKRALSAAVATIAITAPISAPQRPGLKTASSALALTQIKDGVVGVVVDVCRKIEAVPPDFDRSA
jgi:hypothetical protein